MTRRRPPPILIAGPTASGKSALALALAERCHGVVVNADSMQVYRELRVLTARPSPEEEGRAPHALYGHVSAADAYSVARWLDDVAKALADAATAGRRPIVVGGTGLYIKALLEGLSPIPAIPDSVRQRWRQRASDAPPGELHRALAAVDPAMAARLAPGDRQRLTRALEVIEATGRSLGAWQAQKGVGLVGEADAVRVVLRPRREELHARSDRRFEQMVAAGALDEVRALVAMGVPGDAPIMRALGVPQLARYLGGALSRPEAIAAGQLETRQYIKRQETWLKRNMSAWISIDKIVNCENAAQFIHLIDQ